MKNLFLKLIPLISVFAFALSFASNVSASCVYNAATYSAVCTNGGSTTYLGGQQSVPQYAGNYATTNAPAIGGNGYGGGQYPALCAVLTRTMGAYTTGADVRQLQVVLGEEGIAYLNVTGTMNRATQNAVKVFQLRNGISRTGFVGPRTLSAMQSQWCSGGGGGYINQNNYQTNTGGNYVNNYNNGQLAATLVPSSSSGYNITLTWTSSGTNACTINGQSVQTNGSQVFNVQSQTDFTLNCTGYSGGNISKTITVKPNQDLSNLPTVNVSINPSTALINTTATIYWTSTNAQYCTFNGQQQPANGSQQIQVTGLAVQYTVSCTSSTGLSASATVSAGASPLPPTPPTVGTAYIYAANQNLTTVGQSTTITWSSTNTNSCTVTGGGVSFSGLNGTQTVTPSTTTTYQINCTATNGQNVSYQVTVYVNGVLPTTYNSGFAWQNPSTGQPALWYFNGTNFADSGLAISNPGTGWRLVAAADINGDGKIDLIWQNRTTFQVAIWYFNGTTFADSGLSIGNAGSTWRLAGAADINGDGKADLIWQNANGQPAIWYFNGTTFADSGLSIGNPGTTWTLIGGADINGDGRADFLWQNTNGQPAIWYFNGTTFADSGLSIGNPGTSWRLAGAADINSNGKGDLIWQNLSGQPAVWLFNGTTFTDSGIAIPNPGAAWILMSGFKSSSSVSTSAPTATLTANPTTINSGQSSSLTWSSTNATSCNMWGGNYGSNSAQATSGTLTVYPTVTTTYYITCSNSSNGQTSGTSSATVTVNGSSGGSLSANPTTGAAPLTVNFYGTWYCGSSLNFGDGTSPVGMGCGGSQNQQSTLQQSHTYTTAGFYTATLYNTGYANSNVTISVTGNGSGGNITANLSTNVSYTSYSGQPVTLTWSSTNATYCNLSGGSTNVSSQPTNGSYTVYPTVSTSYIVNCYNSSGQSGVSNQAYVTVNGGVGGNVTATLTANYNSVSTGQPVTLTWTSTNANYCSITANNSTIISNQAPSGSTTVYPSTGTNYIITCYNSNGQNGTNYAYVSINGNGGGGSITANLTASQTYVSSGQSVTLSWYSSNATYCNILSNGNTLVSNQNVSGTYLVYPNQTTSYQVNCFNSSTGQNGSGYATVNVNGTGSSNLSLVSNSNRNVTVQLSNTTCGSGSIYIYWGDGQNQYVSSQCGTITLNHTYNYSTTFNVYTIINGIQGTSLQVYVQ